MKVNDTWKYVACAQGATRDTPLNSSYLMLIVSICAPETT